MPRPRKIETGHFFHPRIPCFLLPYVYAVVDPVAPEYDGALPGQSEGRHCNRLVLDLVQIPHLWAHRC